MSAILKVVKPKKKRQPLSFGGKGYDPRPPGRQTPKPPAPTMNWQALLNQQRKSGQPLDFAALQAAGMAAPSVSGRGARSMDMSGMAGLAAGLPGGAPAPGSGGGGASNGGGGSPGSPLVDDAQAAAARAQAIFEATQKRAALVASGAYGASDLEEAVRRLRGQRPDDERNAKTSANNAGLFHSGALVNQLGDIASDYVRREGDERTAFDRSETVRKAQLAAAEQEQTLALAAIDAALQERQAQRDAERAQSATLSGGGSGGLPVSQAQLPKQIFQKDYGIYGIKSAIQGGKLVALDSNGQVIPGAVFGVAGKRRFVRIPGGA